jgi:hypothetical protein
MYVVILFLLLMLILSATGIATLQRGGGSKLEEKYGNMLQPATGSHKKYCKQTTLQNIKSCPRKGKSPIVDSLNGSLLCGKAQRQIQVQGYGQGQRKEQNKLQLQKAQEVQMPVGAYTKKCANCLIGKNKDDGGLYMVCDCPNVYGEQKKTDIGPLEKCPKDKEGIHVVHVDRTGVLNC